jgi:hypothetical protein
VSLSSGLKMKYSIFLNISALSFEYECCRSCYHLQFLQRPYRVFIHRCCTKELPTLNATHMPCTGDANLWASFSCFPLKI